MNIVKKLSVFILAFLLIGGTVFGATVSLQPTTVPIGAYLNGGDGDQYFVQSLEFTWAVDDAWDVDDDVVISLPSGMTIADEDDDGNYDDEVSLSWNATTGDPNYTVTATASTITIAAGTGANVETGDKVTCYFPIVTSTGLTDGSTATYSFSATASDGVNESSFSTVTVTYEANQLTFAEFTTAFTGGDSSSLKGDGYPSSDYYNNSTNALVSAFTDIIVDQVGGAAQGVDFGADPNDWDGITLDNDDDGLDGGTAADAEVLFYFWASQDSGLVRIDQQNGHKPVMIDNVDPDNIPAQFGDGATAGYVEEGADFGTALIDGKELAEGNWYFYVTSSVTSDWVLGASDVVKIKHYPTFSVGADGTTPETGGGVDFDGNDIWEPGDGTADDTEDMYLESGQNLTTAGVLSPGGGVDNVDFFYACEDVDDNASIDIFFSTSNSLTTSDLVLAGTAPNETITELTGATKITSTSLVEDSLTSYYNYDIYTDVDTYEPAGTYYVYFVANDGKNQTIRKVVDGTADADFQLHVKHIPNLTFQDHYGTGAGAEAVNTATQQYFTINWGETIDGDLDADGTQRIRLYASQHDITNDAALIGYSTNIDNVDSTKLADLVTTAPTQHALIMDRMDVSDTREANRYMWNIKDSGLEDATYYIYALTTQGGDAVIYQAQSGTDVNGDLVDDDVDDQTITLTHGTYLQPTNPAEDQIVELDREDTYEIRWDAYDMDGYTGTNEIKVVPIAVLASATQPTPGTTVYTGFDNTANYYYLATSDDGESIDWANAVDIQDNKFSFNVADIDDHMAGGGSAPDGLYNIYLYYENASDGNTEFDDNNGLLVAADGQIRFLTTGNESYAPNFKMTPTKSQVGKGDTLTVEIYAVDEGPDPEFLQLFIDIADNTYFTVLDQDASTTGTQPFLDETDNFDGAVQENKLTETESGYQLDFVEWASGGNDLATSLKVATVQLKVTTSAPVDNLVETMMTFSQSGTRTSGLISADGTEQNLTFSDGATLGVIAGGKISGNIDIEARADEGEVVDIYVAPLGSYDCITDADFLSANGDDDATDGIQVTLGAGGTYELTQVPAGKYDVIVHKDGFLDQRSTNNTVYPLSITNVDFNGTDKLLAGDVAGYDHDGSAATAEEPDNQIGTKDTDAITSAFGTTSGDDAWNALCDIDGNGTVYTPDFNYAATNTGSGEGILYKEVEYNGYNNSAIITMNKSEDNVFSVKAKNLANVRAYSVKLAINDDAQKVSTFRDGLAKYRNTLNFHKEDGDYIYFVSAIRGAGAVVGNELELFTFELDEAANSSFDPSMVEIVLIDGNNASAFGTIGAELAPNVPTEYTLEGNYPNPFNPTTNIKFGLPETGQVRLVVYDLLGNKVRTLVAGEMQAGYHNAIWNANNQAGLKVSSGVYFYRLMVGNNIVDTKKMVLMK